MYKTRNLLLAIFTLCLLNNCQKKQESNNNNNPESSIETDIDPAELYAQFAAQPLNEYPEKAVFEVGKVYPVDEAPLDTSFFIFRGQLMDIIKEKNIFKLLPLIDNNIKAEFGGPDGKDSFVKVWQLKDQDRVSESNLWPTLERILSNGGKFSQKGSFFTAPYTFANFPDSEDMFEKVVITGSGVRARADANLNSKVVAKFSHDLVKFDERTPFEETISGETHPWVQVRTKEDEVAYVWGKYVASGLDFRVGFEKKEDGKWKMVFLVAGD